MDKSVLVVHVCRSKSYAKDMVGKEVQMTEFPQFADWILFMVTKITEICEIPGNFEALVAWKGLYALNNYWEPLDNMYDDVPTESKHFFKRCKTPVQLRLKAFLEL